MYSYYYSINTYAMLNILFFFFFKIFTLSTVSCFSYSSICHAIINNEFVTIYMTKYILTFGTKASHHAINPHSAERGVVLRLCSEGGILVRNNENNMLSAFMLLLYVSYVRYASTTLFNIIDYHTLVCYIPYNIRHQVRYII